MNVTFCMKPVIKYLVSIVDIYGSVLQHQDSGSHSADYAAMLFQVFMS